MRQVFWFPFLAPALALGGLFMTRRHQGWRRLAIVAVALPFLVAMAVAAVLLFTGSPRAESKPMGNGAAEAAPFPLIKT